ncbi:MAG: hypothetical protein ACI39H_00605 [Lachnospiraceae bacterium]
MKNRLWNHINKKAWSLGRKRSCFLACYMLFCALCGGACYVLLGQWFLPATVWLISFIGYPCFFVGFLDGMIYLYNR